MAIKEGRCINCGSILFLDTDSPKGHCLFCDCVFDNADAFRAQTHPEEFTFPNEPQPKYEGPSLTPSAQRGAPVAMAPRTAAVPVKEKDVYVLPETKVPDLKIPMKAVAIITAISALVVAVFVAVAFPLVSKRDKEQSAIIDQFVAKIAYEVDKDKDILVHEMKSDEAIVVLHENISAEDGISLFNEFCDIRAEILGIEDNSFKATKSPVSLKIVTPEGGFLIRHPADEESLTPGSLKILD